MAGTVGDKIKALRESKGFSRADLADQLGISQMAVWNWENKGMTPRRELLGKIAKALRVPESQLKADEADDSNRPETVDDILQGAKKRIASLLGVPAQRVTLKFEVDTK